MKQFKKRLLAGILATALLLNNMSTLAYAVDDVVTQSTEVAESGPSAEELAAQQAAADEAARQAAEAEAAAKAQAEADADAAAQAEAEAQAQAAAEEAARQAAEAAAQKAAEEAAAQAAAEEAAKKAAEEAAAQAAADKAAAEAMASDNAGDGPSIEESSSEPAAEPEASTAPGLLQIARVYQVTYIALDNGEKVVSVTTEKAEGNSPLPMSDKAAETWNKALEGYTRGDTWYTDKAMSTELAADATVNDALTLYLAVTAPEPEPTPAPEETEEPEPTPEPTPAPTETPVAPEAYTLTIDHVLNAEIAPWGMLKFHEASTLSLTAEQLAGGYDVAAQAKEREGMVVTAMPAPVTADAFDADGKAAVTIEYGVAEGYKAIYTKDYMPVTAYNGNFDEVEIVPVGQIGVSTQLYVDGVLVDVSSTVLEDANGTFTYTYTLPESYAAYDLKYAEADGMSVQVERNTVTGTATLPEGSDTASYTVRVYLEAPKATYTVNHVFEDNVALNQTETLTGVVDQLTEAQPLPNFDPHYTVQPIVQKLLKAGEETVVTVTYTPNTYYIYYETGDGSFVPPTTGVYNTSVALTTVQPTNPGYAFKGWFMEPECTTVAQNPLTVTEDTAVYAKWDPDRVAYTLIYMTENANDDYYSYAGSVKQYAPTGTTVTADADSVKPDDFDEQHFTFSYAESATVLGDGSAVVRVYYTRNKYTLRFAGTKSDNDEVICGKEKHTHTDACYELTCTKEEHTHTNTPRQSASDYKNQTIGCYTSNEHTGWFGRKYWQWDLTCGKEEHTHSRNSGYGRRSCYSLICGKEEHQHNDNCYYGKTITAKYEQDIRDLWKDAVGYEGSWKWNDANTSFQATMPGEDIYVEKGNTSGNTSHNLAYYIEVDEGTEGAKLHEGHWYTEYAAFTIKTSEGSYPTFNEEFMPIDGYERADSTITNFDGGVDRPGNASWAYPVSEFYYNRSGYDLDLHNYDGNGGSRTKQVPYTALLESYLEHGAPEGKTFEGWYADPELTTLYTGTTMPKGLALYAKWSTRMVTVTYDDTEGHYDGVIDQDTVEAGKGLTHGTPRLPDSDGYIFAGWVDANGNPFDGTSAINEDITVYAQWTPRTTTSYTVQYLNKDTDEPMNGSEPEEFSGRAVGDTASAKAKQFEGYIADKTSKEITLQPDPADNVITFYYTKLEGLTYKVQYVADGKVVEESGPFDVLGEMFTVTADPEIVNEYAAKGYVLDQPAQQYTPGIDSETNIVTFTFENKGFKITYELNGGTEPTPANPTTYYPDKLKDDPITLNNPTRDDYIFIGWSMGNNTAVAENSVDPQHHKMQVQITEGTTGDLNFVAQWLPVVRIDYTVEPANSGTVNDRASDFEIVDNFGDTAQGATARPADGMKFDGWYKGDTKVSGDLKFTPPTVDVDTVFGQYKYYESATYVAKFEPVVASLTVTYKTDDGEDNIREADTEDVTIGGSYTVSTKNGTITVPDKITVGEENYIFDHFDGNANGTMDEDGETVTAVYTKDEMGEGGEPDKTPDKYQVTIRYLADPEDGGNVAPTEQVITIEENGENAERGSVSVHAHAERNAGYTFTKWDGEGRTSEDADLSIDSFPVEGGHTYTFTAHFVKAEAKLTVLKTVVGNHGSNGGYELGATVNYHISVTNDGNVTLSNVAVADEKTSFNTTIDSLAPGATSEVFTTSHVVTEDDILAGRFDNYATAGGQDPDGNIVKGSDSATIVPVAPNAHVTITKETTSSPKGEGYALGETIEYSITVTNDGNVSVKDIVVTDELTGGHWEIAKLEPDQSQVFATRHKVTEDDIKAGSVLNEATATGTTDDPDTPPTIVPGTTEDETEAPTPKLDIYKYVMSDSEKAHYALGDTIKYYVMVYNHGNVTLTNVVVKDELTSDEWTINEPLAPGASKTLYTSEYTVTEADILAGEITNIATAIGEDPDGNEVKAPNAMVVLDADDPNGLVTITKEATSTPANGNAYALGETITYSITATNDGNVTATNVVVTDDLTGMTETIDSLAPGESESFETSHTVTEDDILKGRVLNVATAKGTSPDPFKPDIPVDPGTETVPTVPVSKGLKVTKTVLNSDYGYDFGNEIKYRVRVENTGNVTLTDVAVKDELTGDEWNIESLAPGVTETFDTAAYIVTEDDITAAVVKNTATATGTDPNGEKVTGEDTVQAFTAAKAPALGTVKTLTNTGSGADGAFKAGDTATYDIVVTNTGNTTQTDVVVTETMAGAKIVAGTGYTVTNDTTATIDEIAPGESVTVKAEYTVTREDIENQTKLANTATVEGEGTTPDPVPAEEIPLEKSTPRIEVIKRVRNANSGYKVGDTITYAIHVKNTGDVTVKVTEVKDPLTKLYKWPGKELAPGETMDFETTYTVTDADVVKGSIENIAMASAEDKLGNKTTAEGKQTSTTVKAKGNITIVKETTSTPANGETYALGETITYKITATNDGTLTLTNVVVMDDMTHARWTVGTMKPGDERTFTTSHVVTEADILAGSVLNVATAKSTSPDPDNPPTTTDGTTEDPTDPKNGHVTIDKTITSQPADGRTAYREGEIITYSITATNDGNLTVSNIVVNDVLTDDHWTIASLAPGASETFTASHVVTAADVAAGSVVNTATATGSTDDPDEPDVPVDPGTVPAPTEPTPTPPTPPAPDEPGPDVPDPDVPVTPPTDPGTPPVVPGPGPAPVVPGVVIPDDGTPLAPGPDDGMDIGDDDTPLAPAPAEDGIEIGEDDVPLGLLDDVIHNCCILHLLIMLVAFVVALYYTHNRKSHQEDQFDLRRQLGNA